MKLPKICRVPLPTMSNPSSDPGSVSVWKADPSDPASLISAKADFRENCAASPAKKKRTTASLRYLKYENDGASLRSTVGAKAFVCSTALFEDLIGALDAADIGPDSGLELVACLATRASLSCLPDELRQLYDGLGYASLKTSGDLADPYNVFLENLKSGATFIALALLSPENRSGCSLEIYYLIQCVLDPGDSPLAQRGGTTYGSVYLDVGGTKFVKRSERFHHEQVHSQQWAQHGLRFGSMYLAEEAKAQINANDFNSDWRNVLLGAKTLSACYNKYEEAAGFADGGYGECVQ